MLCVMNERKRFRGLALDFFFSYCEYSEHIRVCCYSHSQSRVLTHSRQPSRRIAIAAQCADARAKENAI